MAQMGRPVRIGPAVELRARIPGPMFEVATAAAKERGVSLAELVRQLLAAELGIENWAKEPAAKGSAA